MECCSYPAPPSPPPTSAPCCQLDARHLVQIPSGECVSAQAWSARMAKQPDGCRLARTWLAYSRAPPCSCWRYCRAEVSVQRTDWLPHTHNAPPHVSFAAAICDAPLAGLTTVTATAAAGRELISSRRNLRLQPARGAGREIIARLQPPLFPAEAGGNSGTLGPRELPAPPPAPRRPQYSRVCSPLLWVVAGWHVGSRAQNC